MTIEPCLVLASASPRRLELLERIGLRPRVVPAEVDETRLPGEGPGDYVLRVATDKAHRVCRMLSQTSGDVAYDDTTVVLAADTAVVLDGTPLGKPADRGDAAETLKSLAGRSHEVLTAVVVIDPDGIEQSVLARAVVQFAELTPEEIAWYVASGEPLDKAGSYAIQGIGAAFVERISGDPSTVVGLPLRQTIELIRGAGIAWPAPTDG